MLKLQYRGFQASFYQGDITAAHVDAVVNAANREMIPGGGVDGAINRGAGPLLAPLQRSLGPIEVGQAVATAGFQLPAKKIIHTVGPRYNAERPEKMRAELTACYRSCLDLAGKLKLQSIAFPAISTGVYHFPVAETLPLIAAVLAAQQEQVSTVHEISFVNFLPAIARAYEDYFRVLGVPVVTE